MNDLTDVVKRYLSTWNETDAAVRRAAIAEIWAEDGVYTDPLATVTGREGFNAVIEGAQRQFPGFTFRLLGDVDDHHDIARFQWELVPAGGGEAPVIGFDTAVVDERGRIREIYGFLDKVPAAA
jgi:hypothetical protein